MTEHTTPHFQIDCYALSDCWCPGGARGARSLERPDVLGGPAGQTSSYGWGCGPTRSGPPAPGPERFADSPQRASDDAGSRCRCSIVSRVSGSGEASARATRHPPPELKGVSGHRDRRQQVVFVESAGPRLLRVASMIRSKGVLGTGKAFEQDSRDRGRRLRLFPPEAAEASLIAPSHTRRATAHRDSLDTCSGMSAASANVEGARTPDCARSTEAEVKLKQFRVRKFRNIIDSGVVTVDPAVTCLVGMNEAGKTAILTALNRLNPTDGDTFAVQRDYPRWMLTKDRRAELVDATVPIEAVFTLTDRDVAAVTAKLGPDVVTLGDEVTVRKAYGDTGNPHWSLDVDANATIRNLLERAKLEDGTLRRSLAEADDLVAFGTILAAADADVTTDATEATESDAARVRAEYEKVTAVGGPRALNAVAKILRPRTPRFFYFSDYSVLEGRVDLSALDVGSADRTASTSDQTARSLLRLAETSPEDLSGDEYEDRKAELEAVGNDLTQQVFKYWRQNPNLRVRFDVDRVSKDNPSHGQPPIVTPILDIRVEDVRHSFTNNFSQRSSGFQWFFSFLAAFTEFEAQHEQGTDFVVLLDEPGLTLHGRAQADLLDFINERLAPAAQVLYTSHSPFMVETSHLERVRVVEDGGPEVGATVSQEILRVGRESLFPLQAALGYDVAQNLFLGEANLLVEGPSDYIYLDTISRHLESLKRPHLDDDWRIMPAGGANNIPSFVALIGPSMDVTVLIDGGTEGGQRLQRAIDAGRLDQRRLIDVSCVTGTKQTDIEDLFEVDDYLRLYNGAFNRKASSSSIGPGFRITQRIASKLGEKRFDHYKPAEYLLRHQEEQLALLSEGTLERFESLFERINMSR